MLDGTPEHQEHNVYKAREREGGGLSGWYARILYIFFFRTLPF